MTQVFNQKSPEDLRKMNLVQRSRYLAYEKPNKDAEEAQSLAKIRVKTINQSRKEKSLNIPTVENIAALKEKDKLTGELKSAEARARVNSLRLKYEERRKQEMDRIFLAQPTSLRALKLSTLLEEPLNNTKMIKSLSRFGGADKLNEIDRIRCEAIIDDREGLTYIRK